MSEDDEGHWDGTHPEDVLAGIAGPVVEWHVLIEETVNYGREARQWTLSRVFPVGDRNEARKRAYEAAESYRPMHPISPQGRRIYQIGIDSWLVRVPGATMDFHFRVSAGRFVGGFDTKGDPLPEP